MKIAIASDDGQTISRQFGRATAYVVFAVTDDKIVARERREKPAHAVRP